MISDFRLTIWHSRSNARLIRGRGLRWGEVNVCIGDERASAFAPLTPTLSLLRKRNNHRLRSRRRDHTHRQSSIANRK
jgi:hypothetical protein